MTNPISPTRPSSLDILHQKSVQLPGQLHDLGLHAPAFRDYIQPVTHQLGVLTPITKQSISWLANAPDIPSKKALKDVSTIAEHCNATLQKIDSLSNIMTIENSTRENPVITKELAYLASFIEAISLTLNAMMHAFHIAQSILVGNLSQAEMYESQMEMLVMRQQYSLINAARLYNDFKSSRPITPPDQSSTSENPAKADEVCFLYRYQNQSLGKYYFIKSDLLDVHEIRIAINRVSNAQTRELILRWARRPRRDSATSTNSTVLLSPTDEMPLLSRTFSLPNDTSTPRSVPLTNPVAASTHQHLGVPQFPGINRAQSSPIVDSTIGLGISPSNASPTGSSPPPPPPYTAAPYSIASPVHGQNLEFQNQDQNQNPTQSQNLPPMQMPMSTQKPILQRASSILSSHSSTFVSSPSQLDNDAEGLDTAIIRYRLILGRERWEMENGAIASSNNTLSEKSALRSSHGTTEIRRAIIARAALKETTLRYHTADLEDRREWGRGGKGKIRTYWIIEKALEWSEVSGLVRRTHEIELERTRRAEARRNAEMNSAMRGEGPVRRSSAAAAAATNISSSSPSYDDIGGGSSSGRGATETSSRRRSMSSRMRPGENVERSRSRSRSGRSRSCRRSDADAYHRDHDNDDDCHNDNEGRHRSRSRGGNGRSRSRMRNSISGAAAGIGLLTLAGFLLK